MTDETLSEIDDASELRAAEPPPQLYLVLECERPLGGSSRHSLGGVDEVSIGRGKERGFGRRDGRLALAVPDPRMSVAHGRLSRAGEGWLAEDAGSKNGTFVNGARAERIRL